MIRFSQLDVCGYLRVEADVKQFLHNLESFCRSMQTDLDIPKAITEDAFIQKLIEDTSNPNEDTQSHVFGIIFCLAYKGTHKLRMTLHESHATAAAVRILFQNPSDEVLQKVLDALVGLLRLEAAKEQFLELCGMTPLLDIARDLDKKDCVIGSATKVIRMLVQNKSTTCKVLLDEGGLGVLENVIRSEDEKCVENGCFALQVLYFRTFDQVLEMKHFDSKALAPRLIDIVQSESLKHSSKFYACCCLGYFVRFNPSVLELCLARDVRVDVEELKSDEQMGLDTEELQGLLDELKEREEY